MMEGIMDTDALLADEDVDSGSVPAPTRQLSAAKQAIAEEQSKTQATELLLNMVCVYMVWIGGDVAGCERLYWF